MKSRIVLFFLLAVVYSFLHGYQAREGLFNYFIDKKSDGLNGAYVVTYEKGQNGLPSSVIAVNGLYAFNEVVLKGSLVKPVVIKIHSLKSTDSVKSLDLFQDVAQEFLDAITCSEMDLFGTHNGQPENYQIILSIMAQFGVNKLQLPTYLFYKNGKQLAEMPVAYGFHTKNQLVSLIKKYIK